MKEIVSAQNLTKNYGQIAALKNISFSVSPGEIFGLLGPSGAGKTTLLKILTGQLERTSGNVEIFQQDSQKINNKLYTEMGMLLDDCGLFERLSCYANLNIFVKIYGLDSKEINAILEQVKLTEAKNRAVDKLSKGMKQRLAFARAIIHNPKILFLDEPTSGLDPATACYIHDMIKELAAKGTTVILTTHNMHEAAKLCDNVALLSGGQIVEYGNPNEICLRNSNQGGYKIILYSGEEMELPSDEMAIENIIDYFTKRKIKSIHSKEVNLETVFIKLTGRGLEE